MLPEQDFDIGELLAVPIRYRHTYVDARRVDVATRSIQSARERLADLNRSEILKGERYPGVASEMNSNFASRVRLILSVIRIECLVLQKGTVSAREPLSRCWRAKEERMRRLSTLN